MKVELEIITDRLPTEADGEIVFWYKNGIGWISLRADEIQPGDVWMLMPPPPKPPIDTSLAASIERQKNKMMSIVACGKIGECKCWKCDVSRIIEAARKWDEHCRAPKTLRYENGIIIIGVPGNEETQ